MTETVKVYDYKTSFFYLVLKALKCLHGQKKTCQGATLCDIVNYFRDYYNISGDLPSQIKNALDIGEDWRFIKRRGEKFSLISPVATLQLIPPECKSLEIDRIQKIFQCSWWCPEPKPKRLKKKMNCLDSDDSFDPIRSSMEDFRCSCGQSQSSIYEDPCPRPKLSLSRKRRRSRSRDCNNNDRPVNPCSTSNPFSAFRKFAQKVTRKLSSTQVPCQAKKRDQCTQSLSSCCACPVRFRKKNPCFKTRRRTRKRKRCSH